jgi:hypothetical protein
MQTLYHIVKILHVMGFVTAIGTVLATFVTYTQFWKLYAINQEQGLAAFRSFKVLQRVGMIGFLVLLVAGLSMLAIMKWSFLSLFWFQIKLVLIVLIFANGFVLGRTSALKFEAFISKEQPSSNAIISVTELQSRLRTFLLVQLAIYACIIMVSVFRFL